MIRAERLNFITSLADEIDIIKLDELADQLDVSVATIRRDVEKLSHQGIVQKTRGGIIFCSKKQNPEPSNQLRRLTNMDEKRRIAQAAFRYLKNNSYYFFDSGSTAHELIKLIPKYYNISIVTYDLSFLPELNALENADVFILGGELRRGYNACHGAYTESLLERMSANVAFIGADSVDLNRGIMGLNSHDIRLKQMMIDNSSHTILLCDHSKFDNHGFFNIHSFDGIDLIITDSGANPQIVKTLKNKGIKVEVV